MKKFGFAGMVFAGMIAMVLVGCGGSTATNPDNNDTNGTDGNTDTTAPVITLAGFGTIYLQKGFDYTDPGATATDDTDGDISSSITVNNLVNKDASGDYTVTYSVSDAAGNSATASRTVHVVDSIIKKTGQTKSYDVGGNEVSSLRDDGKLQTGVTPHYNRDNSKKIVTDYITGLQWQDNEILKRNFDAAKAECESLNLGGYDDWRMPSIEELMNIAEHSGDPLPSVFQSRDTSLNYWSGTLYQADTDKGWGVDFNTSGTDSVITITQEKNVRCVRGATADHHDLTRSNSTGVVFDPNSGLEWQDNEVVQKSWTEALDYCQTLSLDGANWRLPSYNELYMLLDRSGSDAIDSVFVATMDDVFWASTTYDKKRTDALEINLVHGNDKWFNKAASAYVKCVRTKR